MIALGIVEGNKTPSMQEILLDLLDKLSWAETMMQVNMAALVAAEALGQLT